MSHAHSSPDTVQRQGGPIRRPSLNESATAMSTPHPRAKPRLSPVGLLALGAISTLIAGCAAGVGIGVPILPGVSLGVGVGSGGHVNVGLGTGVGPVGVGVGVNQHGQVSAGAGVGASVPVGNARVGAGVGTGTVIYDPARSGRPATGDGP